MSHNCQHTPVYWPFFRDYPGEPVPKKVKPIWILLKQVTVSGSGISWAICVCTLLQTDNHTSAPPLCFLQAGCPPCHPTSSVKALKANRAIIYLHVGNHNCQQFIIMNTKAYLKSSHNKHHHQIDNSHFSTCTHTHTHTRLTALFPGLPR